jgi:phosphatidylserine decarboxylase
MIHKEAKQTLLIAILIYFLVRIVLTLTLPSLNLAWMILFLGIFIFLLSFFRNPKRVVPVLSEDIVYAPADGKVVVVEKTNEIGYLQKDAIQVSIFMSPLNVHVNRNPISGLVMHAEHHDGKFLPAWDPKSSTENERTTIVYSFKHGTIVMRQVAGALAKRIMHYVKTGDTVKQGEDMGFIKFGSRVDLYLPLDAEIKVKIGDVVKGNLTPIATWQK